jgi:hypothetical protein
MNIPTDRQIFESAIATYWWEGPVLISLSKSTVRTVETISANVALIKNITNHQPVPLLIYLAKSPVPDKATRQYSAQQLPLIYSAMAMVSKPGLSQLIMRLLFRFQSPPIPIKSFTDDKAAMQWLQQFV